MILTSYALLTIIAIQVGGRSVFKCSTHENCKVNHFCESDLLECRFCDQCRDPKFRNKTFCTLDCRWNWKEENKTTIVTQIPTAEPENSDTEDNPNLIKIALGIFGGSLFLVLVTLAAIFIYRKWYKPGGTGGLKEFKETDPRIPIPIWPISRNPDDENPDLQNENQGLPDANQGLQDENGQLGRETNSLHQEENDIGLRMSQTLFPFQ